MGLIQSKIREEKMRISQSCLWSKLKVYYEKMGTKAWDEDVPYFVTSNRYNANLYAHCYLSYLKDLDQQKKLDLNQWVYLIELGAGSGTFSYHLQREMHALIPDYQLMHLKWCHIMTDVAQKNIEYWQHHPQFQSFFERKTLDIAYLDINTPDAIHLIQQNRTLVHFDNPILLCANYVLDSVPSDGFYVKNGQLYEKLINLVDQGISKNPSKDALDISLTNRKTHLPYYHDVFLDQVLEDHLKALKDAHFFIPTGVFTFLDHLTAKQRDLMLLSTDKGVYNVEQLEDFDATHIVHHGSYSIMVNYMALEAWFKHRHGDTFHITRQETIHSGCFVTASSLKTLPHLSNRLKQHFNHIGPGDFFTLFFALSEKQETLTLAHLLSIMKLSHYDSQAFLRLIKAVQSIYANACDKERATLHQLFAQVSEHHYRFPAQDLDFEIGFILLEYGHYTQALKHFRASYELKPNQAATLYNLGLCHYHLQEMNESAQAFRQALKHNPHCPETKRWLTLAMHAPKNPTGEPHVV